ncbi:MAG: outer membrane beta-barrel family protein [Bacteroidota bacterium]
MGKSLLICCLVLVSASLTAQRKTINLQGSVKEAGIDRPLEYATILIEDANQPDNITGGITDEKGSFSIQVKPGTYRVSVEYISFSPRTIAAKKYTTNTNLGVIRLSPNVQELDAVEIVEERTSVEVRLDKKIYNVGKDLTNSGATISDALDNIPSVTVDVDGVVALRGNDNVRILINDRPSALAGFGSTEALRQLPADAIEKVEVITSPSARYDAEGTAGIINIVLKKEKTRGFNGTINTVVGVPARFQITPNLNFRTNTFNFFTTLGYTYSEPPGNGFFDNTFEDGTFDRIIEDRDIARRNSGFNGNIGLEYFLTENSSLTTSLFGRINNGKDITTNDTDRFLNSALDSQTLRREIEEEDEESLQLSMNYTNDFDDKGQKLTADFQYSYDKELKPITITEVNTFPNTDTVGAENILEIETQNEFLVQVDYVLPMGEAQFEAGYRGNYQETATDFSLEELDTDTGDFIENDGLTNRFVFNQDVNALYTQYGNKFGKFSFLAGLRLEQTRQRGEVSGVDTTTLQELLGEDVQLDFDKNFLNLFPTLNLTYELREEENVTLGYNRRINRPRGWFTNPFPSRSSRTNVFQGNPDLDPAFADAFDLGYLRRWKKLTLTASVYYQREEDAFERIQEETGEVTGDGIVIIRSIPINLSTNERIGAEVGMLYNPTKWWRINSSFNFFEFNTSGFFRGIDLGATNTSWFTRFGSKVSLPGKIDWQTNFFYNGPTENAQTKRRGIFTINLALSKDVLKDKGTIALNASDLFNSRKRLLFTETPFFTSDSEFQWRERQINLSFVYRINQKKEENRRSGAREYDGGDRY